MPHYAADYGNCGKVFLTGGADSKWEWPTIESAHFRTLHGKSSVTIVNQSTEAADAFFVVVNGAGQHALWQAACTR
jgi:hypothetical protein